MRSPEILTEPVVYDDLLETLVRLNKQHAHEYTPNSIHSKPGPVVPSGLLLAATDFIAYWQAVGPRLDTGDRNRAEHEATFAAAIAKIDGCDWTVYAEARGVTVYDRMPAPVFSAVWANRALGDDGARPPSADTIAGHVASEYAWYSEHGYWLGAGTGAWHDDIASLLAHHRERVTA